MPLFNKKTEIVIEAIENLPTLSHDGTWFTINDIKQSCPELEYIGHKTIYHSIEKIMRMSGLSFVIRDQSKISHTYDRKKINAFFIVKTGIPTVPFAECEAT